MWVASFSDLSLDARQVLKMERVGAWRRLGKLERGVHYLSLEEAKAANLPVRGVNTRGNSKQQYVYNSETLFELFKNKTYTPRQLR